MASFGWISNPAPKWTTPRPRPPNHPGRSGLPAKNSLGAVDMRDIAPTLAKILKVRLPEAAGHTLL